VRSQSKSLEQLPGRRVCSISCVYACVGAGAVWAWLWLPEEWLCGYHVVIQVPSVRPI